MIKPDENRKKDSEEKKPGIFARLWGKIKGNEKEKLASKEVQQLPDGEMTFDTVSTIDTQPSTVPQS